MTRANSGGRLVLVVGPSGAGKDTLLDFARERLGSDPSVRFVRRAITRPASAGEDHEPVSVEEFERRAAAGSFALHWQAHGLSYGLPAIVTDWIAEGNLVIANGSRAMIPEAERRFPALQIVVITASPDVLATRLLGRGRETKGAILDRLNRSSAVPEVEPGAWIIDNSTTVEEGGEALVRALRQQ